MAARPWAAEEGCSGGSDAGRGCKDSVGIIPAASERCSSVGFPDADSLAAGDGGNAPAIGSGFTVELS